jgi:hypothetical protein
MAADAEHDEETAKGREVARRTEIGCVCQDRGEQRAPVRAARAAGLPRSDMIAFAEVAWKAGLLTVYPVVAGPWIAGGDDARRDARCYRGVDRRPSGEMTAILPPPFTILLQSPPHNGQHQ